MSEVLRNGMSRKQLTAWHEKEIAELKGGLRLTLEQIAKVGMERGLRRLEDELKTACSIIDKLRTEQLILGELQRMVEE